MSELNVIVCSIITIYGNNVVVNCVVNWMGLRK